MQRKRSFTLHGKIILSDRSTPKPWPEAIYFQDLLVFRSDRALTSTWFGQESCQIDINARTFRCDSLLPGEYTFYFEVSPGLGAARSIPTQVATVRYNVRATANQTFIVQLREVSGGGLRYQMPFTGRPEIWTSAKFVRRHRTGGLRFA